jgi:hypothetical protein
MRLLDISADAHPDGNRIDLAWTNPDPVGFPGVRVVRREGTHPETPDDGVRVAQGLGVTSASDTGLKGETVYYYALFPFAGTPPTFDVDRYNRATAMATSPYDLAGLMYQELLPSLYRRFDATRLPAPGSGLATEDLDKGQLRRFLELPGSQLDRLYSFARAILGFHALDRVDGRLLPLLAQWIGWRTDYGLPVGAQRNEIRFAPALYQAIGGVPTLEATVARITGWPARTKEFVHNVARTNSPERLNLWSVTRDTAGTLGTPTLASVNFAYDGRPAAAPEAGGAWTVFYHTFRRHGWDIWAKRFEDGQWQPSEPVVDRPGIDKHPTAAPQGDLLWLFWQSYDPTQPVGSRRWRVLSQTRSGGAWSAPATFGDEDTERRRPAAVADDDGGVWLFWLEPLGDGWQFRYNRHDGTGWQLDPPGTLPPDPGTPLRLEDDPVLLFHPSDAGQRLWLFWARQEPGGPPGQTRWAVFYRVKAGLDPAVDDWSPVRPLPRAGAGARHDRQPAPLLAAGGDIELFFSSDRGGSWSIFANTLDTGAHTWGTATQVTTRPYAERGPLALDTGDGTLVVFRSNESLARTSDVFGATRTLDHRYGGTTTVDTRDAGKLTLRGTFEDFQTYTYDLGAGGTRTNADRISRDTVGLFLTPDTNDPEEIAAVVSRLGGVLGDFMPVTTRAVFITPP